MIPSSVAAVYDRRILNSAMGLFPAVRDRRFRILLSAAALALTACSSAVTPEKITLVKPYMTPDQVEAILGRPASIEQSDSNDQLVSGEVDHYPAPNGEGRVVFVNKAVFKAEFIPGVTKP